MEPRWVNCCIVLCYITPLTQAKIWGFVSVQRALQTSGNYMASGERLKHVDSLSPCGQCSPLLNGVINEVELTTAVIITEHLGLLMGVQLHP